jgi:hypothetical protein
MSAPQVWLRSAIESAAECDAYPMQPPQGLEPPFVTFERTNTVRQQILADTLDSPASGTLTPPMAAFTVLVFSDDYLDVWSKSSAIVGAIHGFAGEHEGTTIESCLVSEEKDSGPIQEEGADTPTYVVELTVEIRWS